MPVIGPFLREGRAAATMIMSMLVTAVAVGGGAILVEHVSLADQRDTLKAASNAAALAATLEMKRVLTDDPDASDEDLKAALEPLAKAYVVANLQHLSGDRRQTALASLVVTVSMDRDQSTVDVSVQADLGGFLFASKLPFMSAVGEIASLTTKARVERSTSPVEVVLAIDISQSMEYKLGGRWSKAAGDSRMTIVKRAAKDLVRILSPSSDNRVAVGVVPWHIVVRLDPASRSNWKTKDWAGYPQSRQYGAPYWCNPSGSCTPSSVDQDLPTDPGETWSGCLDEHRIAGSTAELPDNADVFDLPSDTAFAQAFFPAPFGASYECLRLPLPADFRQQFCYDGGPSVHRLQTLKPPQHGCVKDMPGILSLTSDSTEIKTAIDSLEPNGLRTYSTLGVAWGQRLLSHSWKSVWGDDTHPVDPDDKEGTRKAIVLLTDGEDNYCGWFDPDCDNKVGIPRATVCETAKTKGTEIFVVTAMHPDRVSSDLATSLRACSSANGATDSPYVFLNNATDESLEAAFASIANQLVTVRRLY